MRQAWRCGEVDTEIDGSPRTEPLANESFLPYDRASGVCLKREITVYQRSAEIEGDEVMREERCLEGRNIFAVKYLATSHFTVGFVVYARNGKYFPVFISRIRF